MGTRPWGLGIWGLGSREVNEWSAPSGSIVYYQFYYCRVRHYFIGFRERLSRLGGPHHSH